VQVKVDSQDLKTNGKSETPPQRRRGRREKRRAEARLPACGGLARAARLRWLAWGRIL